MRLIDSATLECDEFFGDNIPEYAILSHRWELEEVILPDIRSGTAEKWAGYRKIRCCAAQAQKNGLRFIWIDTCCIDKTSSAELTEAINSMFRWYQEASVCYAYLTDVQGVVEPNPEFPWSKWFTRGWTLQELIAPRHVTFFNSDWVEIGTKLQLADVISEVTAIPVEVLNYSKRPDEYSVPGRMA